MKLEVGMYVRTPYGIRKIVNITKDDGYKPRVKVIEFDRMLNTRYKMDYIFYTDEHTIKKSKASHNIIDLIEVGDILKINNEKYEVIYDESYEKLGILIPSRKELSIRHSALEYVFKKYNVSIVTSQQFESISYKVGGSNE